MQCVNLASSISLNSLGNCKNTLCRHVTGYYRAVRHSPLLMYSCYYTSVLVSTMHQCEFHPQNTLKNSLNSIVEAMQFNTCVSGLTFDAAALKNEQILCLCQSCTAFYGIVLSVN